jgi:hypothetical protein
VAARLAADGYDAVDPSTPARRVRTVLWPVGDRHYGLHRQPQCDEGQAG